MCKIFSAFFFYILLSFPVFAQVLPREGSKLNYRLLGFSFPRSQTGSKYKIEIAIGKYGDQNAFEKHIIKTILSNKNKVIGEVPFFGRQYTWRVVVMNDPNKTSSPLHHFNTSFSPKIDTNINRLRIIKPAKKYKDAYVLCDGAEVMYDMNGAPVWYRPDIAGEELSKNDVRDMKVSPMGTITFTRGEEVTEINYDGKVLWTGPHNGKVSGDSLEHFHHEFTRLSNGHYMVLGVESVLWNLPNKGKDHPYLPDYNIIPDSNNGFRQKIDYGTVIEYDEKGNVIWSWKSSSYFRHSDIYRKKTEDSLYFNDVHENAFYFDQKKKAIYVSFKTLNRIVKIRYPEGTVLDVYGEEYVPNSDMHPNGLFCKQHCCRISSEGYLYLFNNNDCSRAGLPKIVMMKEPDVKGGKLKKVWEYDCIVDGVNRAQFTDVNGQFHMAFMAGGNVFELPDHSIFANMPSRQYVKVFIVDKNKNEIWSALPEHVENETKKWISIHQYRASIITDRAELERLIWNAEKTE